MAGLLPWLPRPADCVHCGVCELVCPTAAIVVPGANLARTAALPVENPSMSPKMKSSET
jgi:ferredoxin